MMAAQSMVVGAFVVVFVSDNVIYSVRFDRCGVWSFASNLGGVVKILILRIFSSLGSCWMAGFDCN
jgi:hypothetical protein